MDFKVLFNLLKDGILKPEDVWKSFLSSPFKLNDVLKNYIIPLAVAVSLIAMILNLIFGYPTPHGLVHIPFFKILWMAVGNVVSFIVFLYLFGWIGAYLSEKFEGKRDFERAFLMLFFISLPSLAGQVLGAIPIIGVILSLVLSVYSLVLLFKAFPVFLDVPKKHQVKIFVLFLIISFILGTLLAVIMGAIFSPKI